MDPFFFGCSVDIKSNHYQAKIKSAERPFLGEMCVDFICIRQSYHLYLGRVTSKSRF